VNKNNDTFSISCTCRIKNIMRYCKPILIDMNSIGITAYGQCINGSIAESPSCFTGGGGVNTFEDCTSGTLAAGYDRNCAAGAIPTIIDACSSGTAASPLQRCVNGTAVT
jgi:hypothetical protein